METPWTKEYEAQLRALWAEGRSILEIGRRMSMSKNAIVGKAHRMRLPPRPSPIGGGSRIARAITEEDRAMAAQMWMSGASRSRIGTKLKRHIKTVSLLVLAFPDQFPPRGEIDRRSKIIRTFYDTGAFLDDVPTIYDEPKKFYCRTAPTPLKPVPSTDAVVQEVPPTAAAAVPLPCNCLWPLSSGRPWRFYDTPIQRGRRYCAAHEAVAFVPGYGARREGRAA